MVDCGSERQERPHAHPSLVPRCCLTQTTARGGYFNPPWTTLPYLAASRRSQHNQNVTATCRPLRARIANGPIVTLCERPLEPAVYTVTLLVMT